MYIDFLRHLREAVKRKRPEKTLKQQLISPSPQFSSKRVAFIQGFLSREKCDNTTASAILSPDLAPADSYLFPQLKVALKERRFCNAAETLRMQRTS